MGKRKEAEHTLEGERERHKSESERKKNYSKKETKQNEETEPRQGDKIEELSKFSIRLQVFLL